MVYIFLGSTRTLAPLAVWNIEQLLTLSVQIIDAAASIICTSCPGGLRIQTSYRLFNSARKTGKPPANTNLLFGPEFLPVPQVRSGQRGLVQTRVRFNRGTCA